MKNNFLTFLLMSILLLSCTPNSKKETKVRHIINIDINKGIVFNASESVDSLRYITLETTKESIINKIDKIYVTDSVIIIYDSKLNEILQFDKTGKFIRKYGKKGQGPGEHIFFTDIFYDDTSGLIYANEGYKRSIFVYNMYGKLVSELSTKKYWFRSFIKVNNGFWIYSCYKTGNNPSGYNLMLVDNEFKKTIKGFLPQKQFFRTIISTAFVQKDSNNFLFIYPNSNIVYQINEENIIPLFNIDFGNKTIPYSKIPKLTGESEYSKLVNENGYLGDINDFHFCQDKFYFTFTGMSKHSNKYSACYDTVNRKVEVYNRYAEFKPANYERTPFSHITFIQPIGSYKNMLIYSVNPSDLVEKDLLSLQNRSSIPIKIDSNPILFLVKHKDKLTKLKVAALVNSKKALIY